MPRKKKKSTRPAADLKTQSDPSQVPEALEAEVKSRIKLLINHLKNIPDSLPQLITNLPLERAIEISYNHIKKVVIAHNSPKPTLKQLSGINRHFQIITLGFNFAFHDSSTHGNEENYSKYFIDAQKWLIESDTTPFKNAVLKGINEIKSIMQEKIITKAFKKNELFSMEQSGLLDLQDALINPSKYFTVANPTGIKSLRNKLEDYIKSYGIDVTINSLETFELNETLRERYVNNLLLLFSDLEELLRKHPYASYGTHIKEFLSTFRIDTHKRYLPSHPLLPQEQLIVNSIQTVFRELLNNLIKHVDVIKQQLSNFNEIREKLLSTVNFRDLYNIRDQLSRELDVTNENAKQLLEVSIESLSSLTGFVFWHVLSVPDLNVRLKCIKQINKFILESHSQICALADFGFTKTCRILVTIDKLVKEQIESIESDILKKQFNETPPKTTKNRKRKARHKKSAVSRDSIPKKADKGKEILKEESDIQPKLPIFPSEDSIQHETEGYEEVQPPRRGKTKIQKLNVHQENIEAIELACEQRNYKRARELLFNTPYSLHDTSWQIAKLNYFVSAGYYDQAMQCYEDISGWQNNNNVLQLLIKCSSKMRCTQKVQYFYDHLSAIDPYESQLLLGKYYISTRNYKKALSIFENMQSQDNEIKLQIAICLKSRGEIKSAITTLKSIAHLKSFIPALNRLVSCYNYLNEHDKAIKFITRLHSETPKADFLLSLALSHQNRGLPDDTKRAYDFYIECIETYPYFQNAYFFFIKFMLYPGNREVLDNNQLIMSCTQAIKKWPHLPTPYTLYASYYRCIEKNLHLATQIITQALSYFPYAQELYEELRLIYLEQNNRGAFRTLISTCQDRFTDDEHWLKKMETIPSSIQLEGSVEMIPFSTPSPLPRVILEAFNIKQQGLEWAAESTPPVELTFDPNIFQLIKKVRACLPEPHDQHQLVGSAVWNLILKDPKPLKDLDFITCCPLEQFDTSSFHPGSIETRLKSEFTYEEEGELQTIGIDVNHYDKFTDFDPDITVCSLRYHLASHRIEDPSSYGIPDAFNNRLRLIGDPKQRLQNPFTAVRVLWLLSQGLEPVEYQNIPMLLNSLDFINQISEIDRIHLKTKVEGYLRSDNTQSFQKLIDEYNFYDKLFGQKQSNLTSTQTDTDAAMQPVKISTFPGRFLNASSSTNNTIEPNPAPQL